MIDKIINEIYPRVKGICTNIASDAHADDLTQEVMIFAYDHKLTKELYNRNELIRFLTACAYKMYHLRRYDFFKVHRKHEFRELELFEWMDYEHSLYEDVKETPEQKVENIINELDRTEKLWLNSYLQHYSSENKLSKSTGIHRKCVRERLQSIYADIRNS